MQTSLPTAFCERMKELLQQEYASFLLEYERGAWHGLRVNTLKVSSQQFLQLSPFSLAPVPWCEHGFYFSGRERPGKHPFHAAGLYYLQEPSAMAVAEALGTRPGEVVLDLCAAPGGKSTHIAQALRGEGLLVANEIHPTRAKALSENIERLGVTNAIVTNETPERLAERFPSYFDRILVDAPCSGEGMFRKLPEARADWSMAKVEQCHTMQVAILRAAARMLKPGGTLVYSTCTFAPEENEQTVEVFLAEHPEFSLLPVPHRELFQPGQPAWTKRTDPRLTSSARLWPHHVQGEGHFLAKLFKQDAAPSEQMFTSPRKSRGSRKKSVANTAITRADSIAIWRAFAEQSAPGVLEKTSDHASYTLFGDQLYYLPAQAPALDGLKVLRPGWHLGTVRKNRFEPSHALALALTADQATSTIPFSVEDSRVVCYLRGESLSVAGNRGWTLVCVEQFPLGWGKLAGGLLKNHYPKGLRWL